MDGDGYSNLGIPPSVAGDVRPEAVGATGIRQTSNGTGSFPFPIASLHDLATINTALGIARRWSCETCRKRKIRCDGVRPSCGFCVRKKIVPCIYVGTKDRADIDLARQFEAERRRRRTVKPDPPGKPAKKSKSTVQHGSWSVGHAVEGNSWIEPAEARCTSSYAETQLSGPADSSRQPYSSSAAYFDSPTFSATPGPQLPPLHTNWNDPAYRRPGSEPDEHYALITQFFKFPTLGASHVHKRSLLMSFDYISPLFRLALCACGALIARASSISKDVVQWYYDQACALAKSAMQNVSLETFQALLLLIQVANGHCQRSAWSATLRDAVQMAVSLNLNVDPDLLPRGALIEGSWLEKETRRRCWWACYLIERNLACTFFQTPVLSRDVCSVKPICPDNIWTSPKTPSELEVLYNLSADPRSNTLNFLIRITDIYGDIVQASIPEPLETMDLSAVSMREERLGQELEDFKNALPESSVLQLDRQWMYETMETDLFHFNGVVGCYLLYQGGRCLLMRRRALLYLREMSAALEGSRLVPDEANRVALQKALSSAVSMARFIAALLKWPGAVQRIPNILIPPIVQGSMTLVMTDGLIAPFTRSPDFGEMSQQV
ncbi:fungal-specific transcription factor domain-containing protein [Zopfochytrium polystomum]|nr:fungal-specific transcription factor domain-containing protein [Zopfochytrium polystomum]